MLVSPLLYSRCRNRETPQRYRPLRENSAQVRAKLLKTSQMEIGKSCQWPMAVATTGMKTGSEGVNLRVPGAIRGRFRCGAV